MYAGFDDSEGEPGIARKRSGMKTCGFGKCSGCRCMPIVVSETAKFSVGSKAPVWGSEMNKLRDV
jgi:hypothetical protein